MAGKKDKLVIQKAKGRITPEQELATDSVIYRLGDTPAYAHTYVRFMKAGTKTAAEKLDNAVGRYVRSVKQIMKDQIENLDTREKQLYKLLKIQTFTEFRKVWTKLTELQKGANGMTLDQAIKCLMQLEQAAMHLAEAKTSNQDFSQEDLKTIQQSIEQLKPFFNDKSPAQTILNDPKFQFSTDSNGNLIAMETSNLGMSMKKQIGILNEWVFVPNIVKKKANQVWSKLEGIKKGTITAKRVGDTRKEGAKDVSLSFKGLDEETNEIVTLDVGITIKARSAYFFDKNLNKWTLQNRFGGGQNNLTFNQAFHTNAQLAHPISAELDNLLKYLLTNYGMFSRRATISNQDLFIRDVQMLLIYGYAIFGVLGENWKNVPDLVPLFYFSGGKLYQTQAILRLLEESSDITIYANKSYGSWMQRTKLKAWNKYDILKQAKKDYLQNMSEHSNINYDNIKNYTAINKILQEIEQDWINKKLFSIKLKIADSQLRLF